MSFILCRNTMPLLISIAMNPDKKHAKYLLKQVCTTRFTHVCILSKYTKNKLTELMWEM